MNFELNFRFLISQREGKKLSIVILLQKQCLLVILKKPRLEFPNMHFCELQASFFQNDRTHYIINSTFQMNHIN